MEVPKIYSDLIKYYHENKLSHAYLIETNNQDKCLNHLKYVIKNINCKNTFKEGCEDCNLCNLLEQNFLPSFIIVEAETSVIKKDQVLDLKSRFSTIPTYTKENIYIIKEAEKLNSESANTMLKFLEEPEDHIIGFFITNNMNNVINTIKSRCEIIKIKYNTDEENILDSPYLELVQSYLDKILINNNNTIMVNRDILLVNYNEKKDIEAILSLMLQIIKKCIEETSNPKDIEFSEQFKNIMELGYKELLQKEKIIVKYMEELQFNVNIELFLDKFVIELSGRI